MATMYPNDTLSDVSTIPPTNKANLACTTCRKQKRKCDKALPTCGLCMRMTRQCDYSDPLPAPSFEDFQKLQLKVQEMESKLNASSSQHVSQYSPNAPTNVFSGQSLPGSGPVLTQDLSDLSWTCVRNKFPSIAFLDSDAFEIGGVKVPPSTLEIPAEMMRLLQDSRLESDVNEYYLTVHKWMPIVPISKLEQGLKTLWEIRSDMAVLLLAVKLIVSRRPEGAEITQTSLYQATKRFINLHEAAGTASLLALQASLLVAWYEYGQAIYPAAYMSAGWCVRYGNLLGINGCHGAPQLLSLPTTLMEQEERRRTWWGVLIVDRLVSMGGQGYLLNSQEPPITDFLPADDQAWDQEELSHHSSKIVSAPVEEEASPFPRLCQASLMIGKVMAHHYGSPIVSEDEKFQLASQLYIDISVLANKLTEEADTSDFLSLASPLALTFTALSTLCLRYSCPEKHCSKKGLPVSEAAIAMKSQAIDGIKTVSQSIVEFSQKLENSTNILQELDRVSPIVMDALYAAAANYAWLVRESGEKSSQDALDSLRLCLRKLGTRWRSAAEYLRILEAQEFTYTVGGR